MVIQFLLFNRDEVLNLWNWRCRCWLCGCWGNNRRCSHRNIIRVLFDVLIFLLQNTQTDECFSKTTHIRWKILFVGEQFHVPFWGSVTKIVTKFSFHQFTEPTRVFTKHHSDGHQILSNHEGWVELSFPPMNQLFLIEFHRVDDHLDLLDQFNGFGVTLLIGWYNHHVLVNTSPSSKVLNHTGWSLTLVDWTLPWSHRSGILWSLYYGGLSSVHGFHGLTYMSLYTYFPLFCFC